MPFSEQKPGKNNREKQNTDSKKEANIPFSGHIHIAHIALRGDQLRLTFWGREYQIAIQIDQVASEERLI